MKTEKFYFLSNVNSFYYYFWKHVGLFCIESSFSIVSSVLRITVSYDLINCYSRRIQRTEIIKIFG